MIYKTDLRIVNKLGKYWPERRSVISVLITDGILVFSFRCVLIESYSADVVNGGLCNVCLILIRNYGYHGF